MASIGDLRLDEADKRRDPAKDFQLLEKLGEGSYGSVWKATHLKTQTITAIKKVPVENDLDEILTEIKIMKQCRSPYIISYYGSYFKDNELWIVMEFCGGGSVSDAMKITQKTLTEDQIVVVLKDALKGLLYLHQARKIHRDVKAGNILLNDKGEGKLADFGVSGQLSDTMAKRNTVIGTPFWMAPEVIQEVGYDVKADIWSLGITVIEMAEGKPPHSNIHPMRAIFMIPSKPPPKLTESEKWSKEMNDFLAHCLTKNSEQRLSAADLLKSPLLAKAKSTSILVPLIVESNEVIARIGREEALGLTTQSDSEDEEASETPRGEGATSKRIESNESFDTMVVSGGEDFGTMKAAATEKPGYIAPFMQKYRNQSEAPKPRDSSKWEGKTTEDLKKQIHDLTGKMDKEIEAIKARYAKQKKELEGSLQRRKMKK
eukprot:TRINITY_DN15220_c0_g1_i1.p1 TRINITY_DN15220_c0_g1~~TRINITY_DN15220_c0_g1_i1.p1  ORF type:complete len:431 (-),score=113.41 TRINITY_DN15220_c0_g1_i1:552-1844(-)